MNDKKYYVDLIEKICFKYNLSGSLIEKTYIEGISNNNLGSITKLVGFRITDIAPPAHVK